MKDHPVFVLLASCTLSALLATYSLAADVKDNGDTASSTRLKQLRLGTARNTALDTTLYFYSIQEQAKRCLDFLDYFKEDFTMATLRRTWSQAEEDYGGHVVDTHPDELPPANPGTLEDDMQLFYSISQRCVTGITHLLIDLNLKSQDEFMEDISNFEVQMNILLDLLESSLDSIATIPANDVTEQLLTTATYQQTRGRKLKERDFLYLSHCYDGLQFIDVVAVKH
ncbi:unnamed protein product [Meganyctiphanes norvegica]|uniref:Uncharacterized protein n=1 Tax=Meganyctiphanes norvegica TaxID=48144 RepID=A0AAV2QTI2_MEGNR